MMIKGKLDGTVDESLADREFHKFDDTAQNVWKIWRPTTSGTGSYSRKAGWLMKYG